MRVSSLTVHLERLAPDKSKLIILKMKLIQCGSYKSTMKRVATKMHTEANCDLFKIEAILCIHDMQGSSKSIRKMPRGLVTPSVKH